MKTAILSSMAVVGLLLVALQHQQLGQLRAENVMLQQASAEASKLKADLAKSSDDEAQDNEIVRLHEENHDLLKLRNEVNQLRETRVEFQRVSTENQRLQAQSRNAPKSAEKDYLAQPIVVDVNGLYDRGLSTPEIACQTFFWALRENNKEALARCVTEESNPNYFGANSDEGFKKVISMEIVARRELNADAVKLGITIRMQDGPQSTIKMPLNFSRKNGEWRVDLKNW
jgi:hypothetical protein